MKLGLLSLTVLTLAVATTGGCGGLVDDVTGNDGGAPDGTVSCGAAGQACCNDAKCDMGLTCNGGRCSVVASCGRLGEPCCNGGACNKGLMCNGTTCTAPGIDAAVSDASDGGPTTDASVADGAGTNADAGTEAGTEATCLLWLKMNADQTGNPVDSSAYAWNVAAMGGTSHVAGGGPGGPSSVDAWSFDGVDGYLAVPYFDLTAVSEVTVTAWFLVSVQPNPPSQEEFVYHGGGGEFALVYEPGGSGQTVGFGAKTTDTNWYSANALFPVAHDTTWAHLAGTWTQGQGVQLYLDGQLVASITAPDNPLFPLPSSWASRIGMYGGANIEAFDGSLADVRIYDRALSGSEVQAVYGGQAVGCGM